MATRDELIGTDRPADWQQALAGIPHGFHHGWACCHAVQLNTGWPTYLYHGERDGVRVVCPLSERVHRGAIDWVTPTGFSGFASNGHWPGFVEHWQAFARSRGVVCAYLAQHPAFGDEALEGPAEPGGWLHLLDLADGAAATLARARKGRRRELRTWHAAEHALVEDPTALRHFALAEHEDFMRRAGASAAAHWNPAALCQLLDAPDTVLVGAATGGVTLDAVLLVGHTRWGAEGLFNVWTGEGRQHTVALLARAVELLAERGLPWFNLGGGVRDGDAIAAAKREWNPRLLRFRRLKQVFRPDEFERLCREAGATAQGYFPPYHRPGLLQPPR